MGTMKRQMGKLRLAFWTLVLLFGIWIMIVATEIIVLRVLHRM